MEISGPVVLLAILMTVCAGGVKYGAAWVSRHSDAQIDKTKRMLQSRQAAFGTDLQDMDDMVVEPSGASWTRPATRDDSRQTGRHHVSEQLLRAKTYRLGPERIGRARGAAGMHPTTAGSPGSPTPPAPRAGRIGH